jgi:hypothetical protein
MISSTAPPSAVRGQLMPQAQLQLSQVSAQCWRSLRDELTTWPLAGHGQSARRQLGTICEKFDRPEHSLAGGQLLDFATNLRRSIGQNNRSSQTGSACYPHCSRIFVSANEGKSANKDR